MEYRIRHEFRFASSWEQDTRRRLIEQGFKQTSWSDNHFYKEHRSPKYSAQVKTRCIGVEPEGFCNSSTQYNTRYYSVSKADYEAMELKPDLTKMVRPLRLRNYDWHSPSITQEEKIGMGWEECDSDFNTHNRYIYFVE